MARLLVPRSFAVGRLVAVAALLLAAAVVPAGVLVSQPRDDVPFLGLDAGWHDLMLSLRAPFWDVVNFVLNVVGFLGALILQTLLAIVLMLRRRPGSAAFCLLAAFLGLMVTQLVKFVVDRSRPADAVVLTDTGSYPSGHVSATTVLLVVLALLIGRLWAWLISLLGIACMMISRTYLAAHWLMDVVGAVCLSTAVVLLLWAGFQKSCVQENVDAERILIWRARASRRRQAAERAESAPQ
jgi:undecaprenyl-diphosphatase